jgi:hypothetical protein
MVGQDVLQLVQVSLKTGRKSFLYLIFSLSSPYCLTPSHFWLYMQHLHYQKSQFPPMSVTHMRNQITHGEVVSRVYFLQPHRSTYMGTITRERWNSPCVSLKAHMIFGFPLCSVATHGDNST